MIFCQHKGETHKSRIRRFREGWFDKYVFSKHGIDIGCGADVLHESFEKWDRLFGNGDAQFMGGVPDETYQIVYASHVLEHMENPKIALSNWYRILKSKGYLIILVPHRDLYEKKQNLPSQFNDDHKWFFLPDSTDNKDTLSLTSLLDELPQSKLVSLDVLKSRYKSGENSFSHPSGEYSIEAVVQKKFPSPVTNKYKLEGMCDFLKSNKGDVVEVGVYLGGSIAQMAARFPDRMFYGYDTFCGMPKHTDFDNYHKEGDFGSTSIEAVKQSISDLQNIILVKGLYPDSDFLKPKVVLAHIDVDLYESTLFSLRHVKHQILPGGRIYCDDAFVDTCHGATKAFIQFCLEENKTPINKNGQFYIQF